MERSGQMAKKNKKKKEGGLGDKDKAVKAVQTAIITFIFVCVCGCIFTILCSLTTPRC